MDLRLIEELQKNGRQTNVELAPKIGVGEATIRRRLDRLIEAGVIKIIAVPNLSKVGYGVKAIIALEVELSRISEVAKELSKYREIHYLGQYVGDCNIAFWAIFPSPDELGEFIRRDLARIKGINHYTILTEVKLHKRTYDVLPPDASLIPKRIPQVDRGLHKKRP
ncbi:MAG: Lrp/AsnC family transcriptional regulator [Thermodesulfobacteriota bacterium]|nr:Lrp/AsnC family transcriptional regulator [Thermodesulfobacteriota bacterium]